jgi:hypothetical protein
MPPQIASHLVPQSIFVAKSKQSENNYLSQATHEIGNNLDLENTLKASDSETVIHLFQ